MYHKTNIFSKMNWVVLSIIIITVYCLFTIKEQVSALNYQFIEIDKQLAQEKDAIHILKAELSYLSSPARLTKLLSHCSELETVKITQLIKDPLSSTEELGKTNMESNTKLLTKAHIKWRYKKSGSKYLQTVSNQK
jgi:hypothetical protein